MHFEVRSGSLKTFFDPKLDFFAATLMLGDLSSAFIEAVSELTKEELDPLNFPGVGEALKRRVGSSVARAEHPPLIVIFVGLFPADRDLRWETCPGDPLELRLDRGGVEDGGGFNSTLVGTPGSSRVSSGRFDPGDVKTDLSEEEPFEVPPPL